MAHFGWNLLLVGVFRRSPSENTVSKKLPGKREKTFLNFSENCQKIASGKSKICIFLRIFKCKGTFFKLIGSIAIFRIRGCLRWLSRPVGPNLSLTISRFSISTDEHVRINTLATKRLSKITKIHCIFNRTFRFRGLQR